MITDSELLHGFNWDGEDVTGWLASEKLDGCRGYWDGSEMWTRSGRSIDIPQEWRDTLPAGIALDGEIWAGRGEFIAARNAVNHGRWSDQIQFKVFDAPDMVGTWDERLQRVGALLTGSRFASAVDHWVVDSMDQLASDFDQVKAGEGEGIMVRLASPLYYHPCRTRQILKVKKTPRTENLIKRCEGLTFGAVS